MSKRSAAKSPGQKRRAGRSRWRSLLALSAASTAAVAAPLFSTYLLVVYFGWRWPLAVTFTFTLASLSLLALPTLVSLARHWPRALKTRNKRPPRTSPFPTNN